MSTEAATTIETVFPGLPEYLITRFGIEAKKATIEPLRGADPSIKGCGYGMPFLICWPAREGTRRIVLETVRPGEFGHEDRSDRAGLVLRAFDDSAGLPSHVRAIDAGAFLSNGKGVSLARSREFFLISELAEGRPYAEDFERIRETGRLEAKDEERAVVLAEYLAAIHREPVSHPSWYRRRLRDLAGAGEGVAGIADSYPAQNGFVTSDLLRRIETRVINWRYALKERSDRLRTVHGDFHPWNILFRDRSELTVLDRSRGALGEPADDVAALAINYLFFALKSTAQFRGPFADLFRIFWERYLRATKDDELGQVIAPFFAFRALVLANPVWYPHEHESTRRQLFRFLFAVLDSPRFELDEIPAYVERDFS